MHNVVQLKSSALNWLDRSPSHNVEHIIWNKKRMQAAFAKECTLGFFVRNCKECTHYRLVLKAPSISYLKTVNKRGWSRLTARILAKCPWAFLE